MCTSKQYEQWLKSVYYQEEVDLWTQETRDITNEELLARPADERPVEWINPWILSQEDIDKLRKEFKGGYKKWREYVREHIPFLDPETEGKLKRDLNKSEDIKKCGKPMTWTDKQGMLHEGTYMCKHYDICPICQRIKKEEHTRRLQELDGCQYVFNLKKEMVAKYGKQNTYSFTTASGKEVTVVKSEEKIEGAEEVSWQTLKTLSEIVVTGHRTSGTLGIKSCPGKEKKETREVMVQSVFVPEDKKDEVHLAYYEKVKNIQPLSLDDYVDELKKCNRIFIETVKQVCEGEIHFLGKKIHSITEDDLDWTERNEKVLRLIERLKLAV